MQLKKKQLNGHGPYRASGKHRVSIFHYFAKNCARLCNSDINDLPQTVFRLCNCTFLVCRVKNKMIVSEKAAVTFYNNKQ